MIFITDFADQAVVLPVAATVLFALFAVGWRRGALAWGASVGIVLAVMLVLKLVTFACGPALGWSGLTSPSGHTATASMVYGGLLALLAPRTTVGTLLAGAAGFGMALLFGLTRLALRVHTVDDVLLGAAVGIAGAMLMRRLAGPRPPGLHPSRLAILAGAVMLLFHGQRMEAETRIRWLALDIWPLSLCREPAAPAFVQGRPVQSSTE